MLKALYITHYIKPEEFLLHLKSNLIAVVLQFLIFVHTRQILLRFPNIITDVSFFHPIAKGVSLANCKGQYNSFSGQQLGSPRIHTPQFISLQYFKFLSNLFCFKHYLPSEMGQTHCLPSCSCFVKHTRLFSFHLASFILLNKSCK